MRSILNAMKSPRLLWYVGFVSSSALLTWGLQQLASAGELANLPEGNPCDLETSGKAICLSAFSLVVAFVKALHGQDRTQVWESFLDFNQLSIFCRPYYHDANATSSCLNGAISGGAMGLTLGHANQHSEQRQERRDSVNIMLMATGMLIAAVGYEAARTVLPRLYHWIKQRLGVEVPEAGEGMPLQAAAAVNPEPSSLRVVFPRSNPVF